MEVLVINICGRLRSKQIETQFPNTYYRGNIWIIKTVKFKKSDTVPVYGIDRN